jgi:transposase
MHHVKMETDQPTTNQTAAEITIPLGIPDLKVLGVELSPRGDVIITVQSTIEGTKCRKCGANLTQIHGFDEAITLRHLPILGRKTYLRLRPKRYRCSDCDGKPTTTQGLEWYTPKSPNTQAYERYLLLQMVNTTLADLSVKEDIGYKELEAVLDRWIERKADWRTLKRLRVLGLDEIALRKGHRDFVVLVTAQLADGAVRIVAVLPNRKKETVRRFLESIPRAAKRAIRTVCSDLYEGCLNPVKEVLPHATLVADRFHIAKLYRDDADQVRKQELRRLEKQLPKAEYKQLKGTLWAFRKKSADLKPEEAAALEAFFVHSPKARQAYEYREQLTAIFDQDLTKEEAQAKIKQWQERVEAAGVTCFDSFFKTLSNWMDEITNYFLNRDTSGFVEGFNNKVKVLKRRCYGIFNLAHLFQRIFLDLEGYRLFA